MHKIMENNNCIDYFFLHSNDGPFCPVGLGYVWVISLGHIGLHAVHVRISNRIECPTYDVVHSGDGYEIRLYNSSMWATTSPIDDISFVDATLNGFLQLFNYIQGQNNYNQQIEMTAPVLTEIAPSDGPFCESSFLVSFYVPKKNQANPPPATGITIKKWGPTYVAVRQFSGFVSDSMVGVEAAALSTSLTGTIWSDAIKKSHAGEITTVYTVAQYNSPFEFDNRVNEIWFKFDM